MEGLDFLKELIFEMLCSLVKVLSKRAIYMKGARGIEVGNVEGS